MRDRRGNVRCTNIVVRRGDWIVLAQARADQVIGGGQVISVDILRSAVLTSYARRRRLLRPGPHEHQGLVFLGKPYSKS